MDITGVDMSPVVMPSKYIVLYQQITMALEMTLEHVQYWLNEKLGIEMTWILEHDKSSGSILVNTCTFNFRLISTQHGETLRIEGVGDIVAAEAIGMLYWEESEDDDDAEHISHPLVRFIHPETKQELDWLEWRAAKSTHDYEMMMKNSRSAFGRSKFGDANFVPAEIEDDIWDEPEVISVDGRNVKYRFWLCTCIFDPYDVYNMLRDVL